MKPDERKRLRELEPPDCGDSSCAFTKKRGGMRTNGGCSCAENGDQVARVYFQRLHAAVPALLDELDRMESELIAAHSAAYGAQSANAALRQEIAGYEARQAEAVTGAEEVNRELRELRERVAVLEEAIGVALDRPTNGSMAATAIKTVLRAALVKAQEG